jgi:hypothetical protein
MVLRVSRCLVLIAVVAAGLAFPAMAQQALPCDAFTKVNGEWVAKRDVMVPGPGGMVQIKAGRTIDEELQQQLDDRCQ